MVATIFVTIFIFVIGKVEATAPGNASNKDFKVYWNVPTFMCHKYGMDFKEVSRDFGIVQNNNDTFKGEEVTMLYDPGMFPALLKNTNGSKFEVIRNGGVPQAGNLENHLNIFERNVLNNIPNENYRGLAIIDFEHWRPTYRQNWGTLTPYQDLSTKIVTKRYPKMKWDSRKKEAEKIFEKWGKIFMMQTLNVAIALRPHATWGYYAFPYCYNITPRHNKTDCSEAVTKENDQLSSIFHTQNVSLPSVYLSTDLSDKDKMRRIRGQVEEAVRISELSKRRNKVLAFVWYRYREGWNLFLSREILDKAFREIFDAGADGYVIWGSSNDLNTKAKCQKFRYYLNETLGPAVVESIKLAKKNN